MISVTFVIIDFDTILNLRRNASVRDPSLESLKASKQMFMMERNM